MNSKELRLSSKKRKKVVFLTSRPPENVKLGRLWSCNCGQNNVQKKCAARAKLLMPVLVAITVIFGEAS